MILDVLYRSKAPEQIQGVRLTTLYPNPDEDGASHPELVIHFEEYTKSPRWIDLDDIQHVNFTND